MQRIIQINIAGRVQPIEEDAYLILKEYINTLERQFRGEDGRDIIEDIENRIAELFAIRLQSGSPAIDRTDVEKVIDTLGAATDLHDGGAYHTGKQGQATANTYFKSSAYRSSRKARLLRNPFDKVVGGVCSGIAIYFDIDPVIVRLLFALLLFTGVGILVYIVAWISIPAAQSIQELDDMAAGKPVTFYDVSRNVNDELRDMKNRAEEMSRELKDFFGKKK
jgi:phage shock protein C